MYGIQSIAQSDRFEFDPQGTTGRASNVKAGSIKQNL
jgi:hypothetical protein